MESDPMEHLKRPYGYEIATLVAFRSLRHSEIMEELYRDDVEENEVTRITDRNNSHCELDVFKTVGSHDQAPFILNRDIFSQGELRTIRERAFMRKMDNDPELTEEDFDGNLESEQYHRDHDYEGSEFGPEWK